MSNHSHVPAPEMFQSKGMRPISHRAHIYRSYLVGCGVVSRIYCSTSRQPIAASIRFFLSIRFSLLLHHPDCCLFWILLHHATDSGWGIVVRATDGESCRLGAVDAALLYPDHFDAEMICGNG